MSAERFGVLRSAACGRRHKPGDDNHNHHREDWPADEEFRKPDTAPVGSTCQHVRAEGTCDRSSTIRSHQCLE